jgi:hypothetical protein
MRHPLAWLVGLALLAPAAGCARRTVPEDHPATLPRAAQVYADTGRGGRLAVRPPVARVWLARVAPARSALIALPPPEAVPESLPPVEDATPAPAAEIGLMPPVLRAPARLWAPPGQGAAADWVDLDVRVDETGAVSEAIWMDGSVDTALVAAARSCALSMRFYPALRAGRAVAVWCRQRFDFRAAAATRRDGRTARGRR